MEEPTDRPDETTRRGDLLALLALGVGLVIFHAATNTNYGWHRDELQVLDDARHLDWGYVPYPPLTPLFARIGLELFGPSLVGVRLIPSIAQAAIVVLTGLMAREMGGLRRTIMLAAVAAAVAPMSLIQGAMIQYVSFDMLWWVLIAYFVVRLLNTDDPRWWILIGGTIGLGMQTKYTMVFFVAGIVVGVLATTTRRHLASPWLWAGVVLSIAFFLPNVLWQARNGYISLEFLNHIHARDVRIGRTDGYLVEQLFITASPISILLWVPGLFALARSEKLRRFRLIGWMYIVPLVLFLVARGRSYYMAAAYPMLFAAGAVAWQHWLQAWPSTRARVAAVSYWTLLVIAGGAFGALVVPVAPVNSALWHMSSRVHDTFREELGWPELVGEVARIYNSLSPEERAVTAIFGDNYGEAGAINLFGPAHGLPPAISGVNSFWARGFGSPAPQTVIVLGSNREDLEKVFTFVEVAGKTPNPYGIVNEETRDHPIIYICRGLKRPLPEIWANARRFG
ncbi:MAG TPA: glycosyltransferase family 39 protein [Blastocatellia bacterium]|nr:glycosyltransferase family 39 protein [Blastocatellia bacterium]